MFIYILFPIVGEGKSGRTKGLAKGLTADVGKVILEEVRIFVFFVICQRRDCFSLGLVDRNKGMALLSKVSVNGSFANEDRIHVWESLVGNIPKIRVFRWLFNHKRIRTVRLRLNILQECHWILMVWK